MVGYAPSGSCSEEKRDFWWKVDEVLNDFGREVKVYLLGDLNAKIGRVMIEGVTGKYGVGDKNENGDLLLYQCAEKGLVIGNTLFEHKDIHKYPWVGDGGRGGRSMPDYITVDERLRTGLEDGRVRRGVVAGMSDHVMVERNINLG